MEYRCSKGLNEILDAVEANLNVKQWAIAYEDYKNADSAKQRLKTMLLSRNDNSLFVYNKFEEINDIAKISQVFKISPVSDC